MNTGIQEGAKKLEKKDCIENKSALRLSHARHHAEQHNRPTRKQPTMTTTATFTFYAQPYALDARGFYFETAEEFETKYTANLPTEEYEIQVIEAPTWLASLIQKEISQCNIAEVIEAAEAAEELSESEQAALVYVIEDRSEKLTEAMSQVDDVVIHCGDAEDAAREMLEDSGAFSGAPDLLVQYFNFNSFARDCVLNGDFCEVEHAGKTWTVTNHNR